MICSTSLNIVQHAINKLVLDYIDKSLEISTLVQIYDCFEAG